MKLVIDPVYTTDNINSCSSWVRLYSFAKDFVNRSDSNYCYVNLPKNDDYFTLPELKNDSLIPVYSKYYKRGRYFNTFFIPDDYLEKYSMVGDYGDYDFFLTTRQRGNQLRLMQGQETSNIRAGLILLEVLPMLPFKRTVRYGNKDFLQRFAPTNYLSFDKVIVEAEFERKGIIQASRNKLSSASLCELEDKIDVGCIWDDGLDDNYIESEQAKQDFINEPFQVFYPHWRMAENQRNFSDVYDVLRYSYLSTSDEIKFRAFRESESKVPFDASFMDVNRYSRERFIDILKKCNVFVVATDEGSWETSVIESCLRGNIGIVKEKPWSKEIFGEDYFGFFETRAEGVSKIKWIYKNKEKAWEKFVSWYNDHFKKVLNNRRNRLDLIYGFMDEWENRMKDNIECSGGYWEQAKIIDESNKNIVDLRKSDIEGINFNWGRRQFSGTSIYTMTSKLYITKFILIREFGWRDVNSPWTVKRK